MQGDDPSLGTMGEAHLLFDKHPIMDHSSWSEGNVFVTVQVVDFQLMLKWKIMNCRIPFQLMFFQLMFFPIELQIPFHDVEKGNGKS